MKIKADYSNAPQWKEVSIKSTLPEQMKCLDEIAHNMWWAWNYEARDMWESLDAKLYEEVGRNPVLLLERLSYERKEAIVKDKAIMKRVKDVYKMFRAYMDVKPNKKRPSVAYFCMEYGITQVLKSYSGGLGSSIATATSNSRSAWMASRLLTTMLRTSTRCPSSACSTRTATPLLLTCPI